MGDCTEALSLDKEEISALVCRAEARFKQDNFSGSQADCNTALAVKPMMQAALAYRSAARLRLGDLDGAITDGVEALTCAKPARDSVSEDFIGDVLEEARE